MKPYETEYIAWIETQPDANKVTLLESFERGESFTYRAFVAGANLQTESNINNQILLLKTVQQGLTRESSALLNRELAILRDALIALDRTPSKIEVSKALIQSVVDNLQELVYVLNPYAE